MVIGLDLNYVVTFIYIQQNTKIQLFKDNNQIGRTYCLNDVKKGVVLPRSLRLSLVFFSHSCEQHYLTWKVIINLRYPTCIPNSTDILIQNFKCSRC